MLKLISKLVNKMYIIVSPTQCPLEGGRSGGEDEVAGDQ